MERSIGLCSRAARENASALQGSHSIGWSGTSATLNYNERMVVLRYAALLTLVVWLGGLVVLGGIAAPSVFEVIGARNIPDGRLLAGAVFGEILRRFYLVSYIAGGVLLLTLVIRAILGPRPRRFAWRAALTIVMLATSVYSGVVIARRIDRVQRDIGVAPSSLAADDPRRIEFNRLHSLSTGLQLVPLLGGLSLIYWELKE
jgi:Domain of unknown function (DUF4149)